MLPNFLIIGAMKAGTTSLFQYLSFHPQVFTSTPKELRFFDDRKGNWEKGLAWYESHFAAAAPDQLAAEASPRYARAHLFTGVPKRIAETIPQVKLIYLLRDPIARMRSHYQHGVTQGLVKAKPLDAFRKNPDFLLTSSYAFQLDHYLEYFPADQILLLVSEELRADRTAALSRVAAFLGIDDTRWNMEKIAKEHNRSEVKPVARSGPLGTGRRWGRDREPTADQLAQIPPPEMLEELKSALRPDVARLRPHLPPEFDGWGLLD
jgi:hypothetical protein